jgi:hypothetical protein
LDTRLDRLVLMFWAAQIILGGSWGAIRGRELLCWMRFLLLDAINKFKEKTHASLIQSGMNFSLNLLIAISRAKGRAVARGASSREKGGTVARGDASQQEHRGRGKFLSTHDLRERQATRNSVKKLPTRSKKVHTKQPQEVEDARS